MNHPDLITQYRNCVASHRVGLLSESVDRLRDIAESDEHDMSVPSRGDLYRQLGDWLIEADRAPEAVQAYQKSTDAYGLVGDLDKSSKMAAIAVQTIKTFWRKPQERIQLLVARYLQEIRDLAGVEGSEWDRANIAFRCAQMLCRQRLFQESAIWYVESSELFEYVPDSEREQAVCHHRLADLYHHEIADFKLAREHYELAVRLYGTQIDEESVACRSGLIELNRVTSVEHGQ